MIEKDKVSSNVNFQACKEIICHIDQIFIVSEVQREMEVGRRGGQRNNRNKIKGLELSNSERCYFDKSKDLM